MCSLTDDLEQIGRPPGTIISRLHGRVGQVLATLRTSCVPLAKEFGEATVF